MSNYGSSKYVKIRTKEQTAKQYIADKVISDQIFEKNLKRLAELHTPAKEKKEKDTMLDKGIKYAYADINGEGFVNLPEEFCKHHFFIKGYEVGNRRIRILGATYYTSGLSIDDAPEEIKNHHQFIDGYNLAKNRYVKKLKKRNK